MEIGTGCRFAAMPFDYFSKPWTMVFGGALFRRKPAMRFMMLMIPKGYETAAPGTQPEAAAVERMMKYNEQLQQAGVLLSLDGLHPPSVGARVTFSDGQARVIQAPFPGVSEVLGGYWLLELGSLDEAIEWAKCCPAGDNETVEVRKVMTFEDFAPDVQQAVAGVKDLQGGKPELNGGFMKP
jgi:hypothetical protein